MCKTVHWKLVDCKLCGVAFPDSSGRGRPKKYCSTICSLAFHREKHEYKPKPVRVIDGNCKGCGSEFRRKIKQGGNPEYCSIECRTRSHYKDRKPNESVKCPGCGNQFVRKQSKNRRTYCNRLCAEAEKRRKRFPVVAKQCKYCLKEFTTRKPSRVYCSRSCVSAIGKECICEQCGVSYKAKRSERFCGKSCSRQWCVKNKPHRYSPVSSGVYWWVMRWKGWTERRQETECGWCKSLFVTVTGKKYCCQNCSRLSTNAGYVDRYESVAVPGVFVCELCGRGIRCKSILQAKKYCKVCRKRVDRANGCHRKRTRMRGLPYEPINKAKLFERDEWQCKICGDAVDRELDGNDPMGPTIDHIMPIAKGGGHIWDNVQLAHRTCNEMKSDSLDYEPMAQELSVSE